MMKLMTVTNISVDGVTQGLGGPDEDPGPVSRAAAGLATVQWRGRDVPRPGLRTRRRVPVRPADIRDLRRFLGNLGRPRRQPYLDGTERPSQVRGIGQPHQPAMGGHYRPVRRPRDGVLTLAQVGGAAWRKSDELRPLCGPLPPVPTVVFSATMRLGWQRSMRPARQHTNLRAVVEGPPIVVSASHAKIRRDGYRRPRRQ